MYYKVVCIVSLNLIFPTCFSEILSGNTIVLIFRPDISNSARMGLYNSVVGKKKKKQDLNWMTIKQNWYLTT